MALNFPSSPTVGQVYTDSVSGFSYEWNGTVWISFSAASSSQIKVIDDISGSFNGVTLSFALTTSGFTLNIANAASLRISLGGVIQSPGIDYSVSGTNIVFTTAPESGLSFSGISLGPAIPVTIIPEGTATVGSFIVSTGLSATNLYVAGVSTFVGLATHTGTIFGNNISLTGIVTASTFRVGTAVTVNSSGINVVGVVTATSFVGSGANLTGISSVSFATTSFGLSGSPAILVSSAGINTTSAPTNLYVSGSSAGNVVGLGTTNANTALNFATGNNFSMTLVGSIVLSNPTGVTTGQSGVIYIQQDGGGSRTVGFGSHWDFPSATAPSLSLTASALDAITYSVRTSTSIVAAALIGIGTL